ncbi:MAG: hypothetical protein GY943_30555 [Chloroflexi bacterium]|nr:hypothetical protein [Chloroflexota bacterium]
MADNNDPAEATVEESNLTLEAGAEALLNLSSDDHENDPDAAEEETKPEAEIIENDLDASASDDDDDASQDDDDEDLEKQEDDDASQDEFSGGRFAADDANTTLADGTVISVGELKRNNLYHGDYSRKTMELAEERKTFEATQTRVNEAAQELDQQRDFLIGFANTFLPQQPSPELMESDPVGYMQQGEYYRNSIDLYNQLQGQHQQNREKVEKDKTDADAADYKQRAQGIHDFHPDLRDPQKSNEFNLAFVNDFLPTHGFTQKEVSDIIDHRMLTVIRKAMAYDKLKKAKPKGKTKEAKQPATLRSGRRMNPDQKISRGRQAKAERARKSGSMNDAVALLMDSENL